MSEVLESISSSFSWFLHTSLQVSVIILLILVIQFFCRKRLSVNWCYFLWMFIIIRMLLPALPESPFSIFNLGNINLEQKKTAVDEIYVVEKELINNTNLKSAEPDKKLVAETRTPEAPVISCTEDKPPQASYTAFMEKYLPYLPALIWVAGIVLIMLRILFKNYFLSVKISSIRLLTDSSLLDLLEECKIEMNLKVPVTVVETTEVTSPSLMGFIRPCLLLPPDLRNNLSKEELRFVILHELAHLKRIDIQMNWLITILFICHWFNPLVWIAFRKIRGDREIACDDRAMSYMSDPEKKKYGLTMIKLVELLKDERALPGFVGIIESKNNFKERINIISHHRKTTLWNFVFGLLLFLLIATVSLTGARKLDPLANNHFRTFCHFPNKKIQAIADKTAEAIWPIGMEFYKWPSKSMRKPMEVHIYRTPNEYRKMDMKLTRGKFQKNLAFSHSDTKSAHIALQPPCTDEVLAEIGLPVQTQILIAYEAAHLMRFHLFDNFGLHPDWFASGTASYIENQTCKNNKWVPKEDQSPWVSTSTVRVKKSVKYEYIPPGGRYY